MSAKTKSNDLSGVVDRVFHPEKTQQRSGAGLALRNDEEQPFNEVSKLVLSICDESPSELAEKMRAARDSGKPMDYDEATAQLAANDR